MLAKISALFILLLMPGTDCIRLLRLSIPSHKFEGERAVLKCIYDLENEELYSVKWYKDSHEIYRFIPGDKEQKVTIFRRPGVRIDEKNSNENRITLRNLNLASAGKYRCEVSAEAPLFNTVSQIGRMEIVVLPQGAPRISGGKHTYHVGDRVKVNCTSERSKPAATLNWYINDAPANAYFLRQYPSILHEDGLETAILGLDFEVTPQTFPSAPTRSGFSSRNSLVSVSSASSSSSSRELSIRLRCSSSVSTTNSEQQTTETHHQKSSVHFSYGSLFRSGCQSMHFHPIWLVVIGYLSIVHSSSLLLS